MSNKTKGTLWSIFMPVVFGLLALVALYNLIYTLRLFGEKGGDLILNHPPREKYADLAVWLYCNGITALKTFYLKDGPRYFPGFNFHTLLFALSMFCLLAFCVLVLLRKDRKDTLVVLSLAAFAGIQLVYYGLELCQIMEMLLQRKVPIKEWASLLHNLGYHEDYWGICIGKIFKCGIILLYAGAAFVPFIDNFLHGSAKRNLLIVSLLALWLLADNTVLPPHFAFEYDSFLVILPFLLTTLGTILQLTAFTWFIKE